MTSRDEQRPAAAGSVLDSTGEAEGHAGSSPISAGAREPRAPRDTLPQPKDTLPQPMSRLQASTRGTRFLRAALPSAPGAARFADTRPSPLRATLYLPDRILHASLWKFGRARRARVLRLDQPLPLERRLHVRLQLAKIELVDQLALG